MNLSDIKTIERILKKHGFSFKKSLGQNFLINADVCPQMAEYACNKNMGVLEIGPGIGVLTKELSLAAKRVVAIELDERLRAILPETLAECDNVEVIFGDAMKLDLREIIKQKFSDCEGVCVCANLPYYITSPIIMMLLESKLPIENITVMVQKEAAERLCADVGTRESGAVTVAVDYYANAKILFDVDRYSFMPPPNVDSAVIQLEIRKEPKVFVKNEREFFALVKSCFAQRRKTLVNTVSNTSNYSKDALKKALNEIGLSETVRAEQLSIEELVQLSNLL
ncbi:MAG: 16S rRNA (adenine(1518)-N(6)/adenine(1519)-N(6))-dimethyltransferase RsmA [Clostridia bacterium]|nr:16S rRNA (adenine(1518)-N(6)/adenine(1519)-N(6))-dimethyltransferase RsmA [Clostridia bacterium]MBR6564394.1 16S rRNA (adenine(1518)-N(6)/adenine(1519)-N(6))-dimethyltransferase RsmA [Clostridia bacterium]